MPKLKQTPVTNALFSLASATIHPPKTLNPILNVFNCDCAEHKMTRARKYLGLEGEGGSLMPDFLQTLLFSVCFLSWLLCVWLGGPAGGGEGCMISLLKEEQLCVEIVYG